MDPLRFNQLYPTIGMDKNDRTLLRWDPVTQCSGDCVLYEECPYQKKGRCSLEQTYMNTIYRNLIHPDSAKGISEQFSDFELQRVGLHLMPLYQQLIRFKKIAFAVEQIVISDKKGSVKIHPIFAEIRTVIREIERVMGALKIEEKWKKKFGSAIGITDVSLEELFEKGIPGSYEEIAK